MLRWSGECGCRDGAVVVLTGDSERIPDATSGSIRKVASTRAARAGAEQEEGDG